MNQHYRRRWFVGLGIGVLVATGIAVTVGVWRDAPDSERLTALGPGPFTTLREGGDARWQVVAFPAWPGDSTPCVGHVDHIPGVIGAGVNCFVDVGGGHHIEAAIWRGDGTQPDGNVFAVVGAVSAEVTEVAIDLVDADQHRHQVTAPPVEATGARHRVFAYVHQPALFGPRQVSTITSVRAIGSDGGVLYEVGPFAP